jgi:hypothetical protein
MIRDTAVGLPCHPSDIASLIETALAKGATVDDLVVTVVMMPDGTTDLRVFKSDHVERVLLIPRGGLEAYRDLVAKERAGAPRSVPIVRRDLDQKLTISFYDLDQPAGGWTSTTARGGLA